MNETQHPNQSPGGVQAIEQWLRDSHNSQATINSEQSSRRRFTEDEQPTTRHISMLRTGKAAVATTVVLCLAASIPVGLEYKHIVDLATKSPISVTGKTLDAGKARIQSVNMNIEPITLSTAKTDAEVSVGYSYKILNISIPGPSIDRSAQVETHIRLDPKIINVNYDRTKKDLTYAIPDFALTAEVIVPADMTDTTAESGSIATFGPDVATAAAKAIAGMNHSKAADVPLLLGYVAKGTMTSRNALEKFAAEVLATKTDESCTKLIPKIPGFDGMLKAEIKEIAQGQIMNPDAAHEGVSNGLTNFWNLNKSERKSIIDKATVKLPTNYTISPDASKITALKKYEKSGVFTDTTNKMACGVLKDFKLTKINDAVVGTK